MPATFQAITVKAPIDDVWRTISNFHDMSWSPHVITKCEAIGSTPGTRAGAKRVLNDAFQETLLEVDEADHHIRYSIDDGPSPISHDDVRNYEGDIHLTADMENNTIVEWKSSWESQGEEAVEFCHNIYVALLNDLAETMNPH